MGRGYAPLATAVHGFSQIGELPFGINVEIWDEGDGNKLPAGDMHVGMRRVGGSGPQRRIQYLPKGGAEMGVCRLRMEPPTGSKGRAPGGGSGGQSPPLKLKAFCQFSYKIVAKSSGLK